MILLKEFGLTTIGDSGIVRAFELQTRCVTALYERLFPRFRTENCWKVLIRCMSQDARVQYRDMLGVYELDIRADVESFFALADLEKKAWVYETLRIGIDQLLLQTQWDRQPFSETFEQMQEVNLDNTWVWNSKWSPSRELLAEVHVSHEVRVCTISLVVQDYLGNEFVRKELISELPDEWAFSPYLGSLTWASDQLVVLRGKNNKGEWSVKVY